MTGNARAGEALGRLLAGNRRFVSGVGALPGGAQAQMWAERRRELVTVQAPFAAVLSCSDSRVVPEFIFDQGLGDLFVVRVAGNVALDPLRASLEFAVHLLDVPLVVVLGHTGCGAVHAAVSGGKLPDNLAALIDAIRPAVALAAGKPGSLVDQAVRANVVLNVERLRSIEGAEILGAVYDLASGEVELL